MGEPVVRRTLANGLEVVVVRNALAPVVTTAINYRVGSVETAEGFPGTAHAGEHMMFRGSAGLSADQLASITAALGGRFNAGTQQTVTQYFFTVPADEFELPLRIEATRMRGVLATGALWQKERGAIEQEVAQDLSNPEFVAYEKILASVFRGTPYAHDPLGTRPSFDRTTAAMLRQFHDTWYAPNNAILVVAGDELEYACDPQNVTRARAILERDLGELRTTPVRPAELLQARRLLLSSIPLNESSEGEIAKGLLSRSADDLPLDEPLRAAERYVELDADDVKTAFRHWVRPDRLAEVVLGPHP
jgi:zinc protease